MRSICITILAMWSFATVAGAQVATPREESRLHHIFARHHDQYGLEQRFDQLKCALVLIEAGPRSGTGFYISATGDVATASHVLGDRTFARNPGGGVSVNFVVPPVIFITGSDGQRIQIPATRIQQDPNAWVADVALLRTGRQTTCWLREADDRLLHPGEHLVALGFPGLSFQALTIYTGIMSTRLTTGLPVGILTDGEALAPPKDTIRVQMPISTGLSGAPVINDENRAVAVVTSAGGWTLDLDHLLMAYHGGAFAPPPTRPLSSQPPNTVGFTLNDFALTAELAGLIHDYASPGYGDAVPLRYLQKPPPHSHQPASHAR